MSPSSVEFVYEGKLPSKSNFRRGGKDWRKKWARIRATQDDIGMLAIASGAKVTDKPIAVTVVLYNQRIDTDNSLKILGDSLEGVVIENDRQIRNWSVGSVKDKDGPRVSIAVSEIEES